MQECRTVRLSEQMAARRSGLCSALSFSLFLGQAEKNSKLPASKMVKSISLRLQQVIPSSFCQYPFRCVSVVKMHQPQVCQAERLLLYKQRLKVLASVLVDEAERQNRFFFFFIFFVLFSCLMPGTVKASSNACEKTHKGLSEARDYSAPQNNAICGDAIGGR